jgi:uncharacterized protein
MPCSGCPTVTDILSELEKPGRDPRPVFKTASFREGVEKLEDVKPGMVLEGVVTNVAAFGAFVDVGVHQDGLVHISAMANTYVSDPRKIATPGDIDDAPGNRAIAARNSIRRSIGHCSTVSLSAITDASPSRAYACCIAEKNSGGGFR